MNAPNAARGTLVGLALGSLIALAFVAIIRVIPESLLLSTAGLVLLYVVQVPVGASIVWTSEALARLAGAGAVAMMYGICAGVGLTDGVLIGFAPSLYGQEGAAMLAVAAAIIGGVTWNIIGVQFLLWRRGADAA